MPPACCGFRTAVNSRVSLYTRDGAVRARVRQGGQPRARRPDGPLHHAMRPGRPRAATPARSPSLRAAARRCGRERLRRRNDDNRRVSVFAPDLAFRHAFGADVVPGSCLGRQIRGLHVGHRLQVGEAPARSSGPAADRGRARTAPGFSNQPTGLAIAPDGRIHVAEIHKPARVGVLALPPRSWERSARTSFPTIRARVRGMRGQVASCRHGRSGSG